MRSAIVLAALVAVVSFVAAPARAQVGTVFKEKDLSEAALVDALTPEPTLRLRSIRVAPSADAPPA